MTPKNPEHKNPNPDGWDIHHAVEENRTDIIRTLLKDQTNLENETGGQSQVAGTRPLHTAAFSNSSDAINLLLDRGAELEARNQYGRTPLFWAVLNNSADAVNLMIKRGADIKARDEDGDTPLHHAAWHNSPDAIKILLDRNSDIEALNHMSQTALDCAIKVKAREAAKALLSYGADTSGRDVDWIT